MNRRHFLLGAAAVSGSGAATKPNVVLVVREGGVPAGQMEGQGLRFTRAYAGCPEVQGAHAALLTGMLPHSFEKAGGKLQLGDVATLAGVLASQGYRTVFEGEWQLGGRAADHGFGGSRRDGLRAPYFLWTGDPGHGEGGDGIVVMTATHGRTAGEPREESVRVPLVVRRDGNGVGTEAALVSHVDVAPAILAWCGAPALEEAHGAGWESRRREAVFAEGRLGEADEWRMLVRGMDKLVVNKEGDVTHLYNLGLDPGEQDNLAESRSQRRRRDELLALMEEMKRTVRDGRTRSGLRRRG